MIIGRWSGCICNYLPILKEGTAIKTINNKTVNFINTCTSLSDSEKEALRSAINEKYNITTVIKTKEELINESLIENDDTFGTVFTKGTLITIEEKDVGNDTFNFNISVFKNGLSMKGYRECVAKKQSGGWSCEIGYTVVS